MKNLTELANPEMNIAKRTLDFVKKQLSRIEFAVTGSFANTILNESNTFNKYSDLDIVVEEKYAKRVANMLLTMQDYNEIEKVRKYAPPRISIEKVRKYDPPRRSIEKDKWFSEYMLKGNLMPVHIIGSYTNKQKNKAVNIDGIKYLESVLPEYLCLAA